VFCSLTLREPPDAVLWVASTDGGPSRERFLACGCQPQVGSLIPLTWCCPRDPRRGAQTCPPRRAPMLPRDHSFDNTRDCEALNGRRFAHGAAFIVDTEMDKKLAEGCGCRINVQGPRLACCPSDRVWPGDFLQGCPN
jgi:hypothetical protein